MRARHIPYVVGGFMLLPYAFWLIAWAVFLPGPKHGFDGPIATAMLAVSVPLVAWFFLANLGFVSNSIDGGDVFERPVTRWVRWLLAKLPLAALLIGAACVPLLLAFGKPPAWIVLPVAMALLVAWAIRRGEAAREHEVRGGSGTAAVATLRPGAALAWLGRAAIGGLYRVPVLGWMLREVVEGSDEDATYFSINLALFLLVIVLLFGFQVMFVVALASVPFVFLLILLLTRD